MQIYRPGPRSHGSSPPNLSTPLCAASWASVASVLKARRRCAHVTGNDAGIVPRPAPDSLTQRPPRPRRRTKTSRTKQNGGGRDTAFPGASPGTVAPHRENARSKPAFGPPPTVLILLRIGSVPPPSARPEKRDGDRRREDSSQSRRESGDRSTAVLILAGLVLARSSPGSTRRTELAMVPRKYGSVAPTVPEPIHGTSPWMTKHTSPWATKYTGPWMTKYAGPWMTRKGRIDQTENCRSVNETTPGTAITSRPVRNKNRRVFASVSCNNGPGPVSCEP